MTETSEIVSTGIGGRCTMLQSITQTIKPPTAVSVFTTIVTRYIFSNVAVIALKSPSIWRIWKKE